MENSLFKSVTLAIVKEMEKGNIPWGRPWRAVGPPRNFITQRPYHGLNVFLLAMRGYASPFWLTRRQAEKKGWRIPEGQAPASVYFWTTRAYVEKKEGEEFEVRMGLLYRIHDVYNTDQVQGLQHLPEPAPAPEDQARLCEGIVENMPSPPEIHISSGGACYSPPFDWVFMPARKLFDREEDYYKILFHELAHSTGHEKRAGRFARNKKRFDSQEHEYSQEELVAELTASFLCAHAGIDCAQVADSAAYIKSWIQVFKDNKGLFFFSAAQAQKAARYILGQGRKSNNNVIKERDVHGQGDFYGNRKDSGALPQCRKPAGVEPFPEAA